MSNTIAVLFARKDSVYKTLPGCDVWDIERDARNWPGGSPIVAHPPCRAWGRLRTFAKPRPDEKDLARWAVDRIREWGGVLEHPESSTLWADKELPRPGLRDEFDGWTFPVHQWWWGHRAKLKRKLGFISWDVRLGICQRCRSSLGNQIVGFASINGVQMDHAYEKAILTISRCSETPSASTHRSNWRSGLSK